MRLSTLSLLFAALPAIANAAVLARAEDPATLYKYETAGLRKTNQCRLYHDHRDLETCTCLPGQGIACIGLNAFSEIDEFKPITDYEGNTWSLGRCECDVPELVFMANFFVHAAALIGHATCLVLMKALQTVTDVGLAVTPLGAGASLGLRMGVQAAKQLSKTDGKDGFSVWMSACPDSPDWMKDNIDNVWTNLLKMDDPDGVADDLSCSKSACPDVDPGTKVMLEVEAQTARDLAERKDRRFAPGWCGMHVTQYQKPDPSKDQYKFDVTLFDNDANKIGEIRDAVAGTLHAPESVGVASMLPWMMMVDAGKVDSDAILFRYGDQSWGSNDQAHHCNFGSYDNGKREGDCGFSCNP